MALETLSLCEIASALGLTGIPDGKVTNISIDNREVVPGTLFFAIKGERFDGHDFVPQAFASGAVAAVVHKVPQGLWKDSPPLLLVEDTRRAFLELGGWYRKRFESLFVVSVTGSVGKTSTKEMIDTVLRSEFRTLKTEGNLNNEIGLPKTLFRLDQSVQAAVIEMGMSGFGEISRLSRAACGDVGVITNIGISHIEKLGSRENILKAKLELLDGLKPSAPLVLNGDDDLLSGVSFPDRNIIFYGIENPHAAIRAEEIVVDGLQTRFNLCYEGARYPAAVPAVGRHHVMNAMAAFAVGILNGMKPERIIEAFARYQPSGMRQKLVDFQGIMVVEDCYNASPDSMDASLGVLEQLGVIGKRVAVLGDMLELGEFSEQAHRKVGALAAKHKADAVLCFGDASRWIMDEAKKQGVPVCMRFEAKQDVADWLRRNVSSGDAVLFKASRGMKFEEIISGFYGKE